MHFIEYKRRKLRTAHIDKNSHCGGFSWTNFGAKVKDGPTGNCSARANVGKNKSAPPRSALCERERERERENSVSRVLALAPPAKLFMNNQHQKASAAAANKSKY